MSIIWTIVVGFIVGLIARWIMPGMNALGFWYTALLGIGGSLVGGIISSLIFRSPNGRFHPAGWILSIVGAVILLWAFNRYMH
ncbi:MAG: GlsB/YeaQ/YmgE family stress response membrane protein [Betaproteobacteria bacterium]